MYTIYCDMDGVLVDFEKGYYELTGVHTKQYVKGDAAFWKPIEEAGAAFWANLPWMSDGQQLWSYIKRYKPNILSAPSQNPSSRVGKEAWCKMHINSQYRKLYLYSRAYKQMFAGPNKILIDDMEQTIREWNNAGGIGIHHTSAANTISQLKKLGLLNSYTSPSFIEQQKQCFHYTNLQPLFKTTEIAESFGYDEIGNRNKLNKII